MFVSNCWNKHFLTGMDSLYHRLLKSGSNVQIVASIDTWLISELFDCSLLRLCQWCQCLGFKMVGCRCCVTVGSTLVKTLENCRSKSMRSVLFSEIGLGEVSSLAKKRNNSVCCNGKEIMGIYFYRIGRLRLLAG